MRFWVMICAALIITAPSPSQAGSLTNTAYLAAEKAHDAGRYHDARERFEKLLGSKDSDIRGIAAFRLHDYYDEGLGVTKDPARASLLALPMSCRHTVRSVSQEAYRTLWAMQPERAVRGVGWATWTKCLEWGDPCGRSATRSSRQPFGRWKKWP